MEKKTNKNELFSILLIDLQAKTHRSNSTAQKYCTHIRINLYFFRKVENSLKIDNSVFYSETCYFYLFYTWLKLFLVFETFVFLEKSKQKTLD